jgi:hypothetical protein
MTVLNSINFSVSDPYYRSAKKRVEYTVYVNDEGFEYSTGTGYIHTIKKAKKLKEGGKVLKKIELSDTDIRAVFPKVKEVLYPPFYAEVPTVESVLECLFLDAEACHSCFEDWCSECGYDTDSRKAEETYKACVQNGLKLRKALGRNYTEVKEYVRILSEGVCE